MEVTVKSRFYSRFLPLIKNIHFKDLNRDEFSIDI